MKTSFFNRKIRFGLFYMLCLSFILLRGYHLLAQASSATITFNQFQTKAACSPGNAKIGIQLFILHPTSTTEDFEVELKFNSNVVGSTSGSVTPLTSMPASTLSGNTNTGEWVNFTNLQDGVYEIKATITTGNLTGNTASSTITITNHLPYSAYFNLTNQPGQLSLDLKNDFCAYGDGITNDVHSIYYASVNFISQRGGNVDLFIPSGTYLIDAQNPPSNTPLFMNGFMGGFIFNNCQNVNIIGDANANNLPLSIFKYAAGQDYGYYHSNTDPNPIIIPNTPFENWQSQCTSGSQNCGCDASIHCYSKTPGSLLNFSGCQNITIAHIEGNGNKDNMNFAGSVYPVISGPNTTIENIQLGASGLRINGFNKNINVSDCNFNNFCLDGIFINGDHVNFLERDQTSQTTVYNLFENINCVNNARCGISITAGKYIKLLECEFNETGQKSLCKLTCRGN
ncbi:MAG TPA: hypothetical protein DCF44_06815 [Chitinophagaceae bacterium]|nr:hypothetical protein [Chitinophagaceae bacterium]